MPLKRKPARPADVSAPTPAPDSLPALPDRRIALRHRHAADTVCRVTAPGEPVVVALVWNISTTGLCLIFPGPCAVGAVLAGVLATSVGDALPVALRVVHCRAIQAGEYALGARFERPLTEAELTPFVAPE